uniref:Reverse transcriptase zinc-binding domain-containing protein n=1 Tax=Setaria viridis TaxID=4556 RepID=A0A4U6T540_SETVI|nr:hypothetical protein SEVIR_9G341600v2 [Setaria viridis]
MQEGGIRLQGASRIWKNWAPPKVKFFTCCSYSKQLWWEALSWMHCSCTFIPGTQILQDWWAHLRQLQPRSRRRGLDSLFTLIIWSLWKERNARLFERQTTSVQELMQTGASRLGCLRCE